MSCKVQQSVSGCVTYEKSRTGFNQFNTFINVRKHKTKPTGIAWTFREERKREQEKAIMQLEKFKKIESNTSMYCTTYKGMKVCAKTEERLNEIVEQLKNR